MRISLIVPEFLSGSSFLQPPLGMSYCASILKQAGHAVNLIDVRTHSIPLKRLTQRVKGSDFIVVTTTPYDQVQNYFVDYRLQYALKTINFLKERFPEIPLAVCGSHGTVRPDLILRDTQADLVIMGEYEVTVELLAQAIAEHKPLELVPNLALRHNDLMWKTHECLNASHPVLPDELMPAYDLLDMDAYYGDHYVNNQPVKRRHWGVILGSRGCPYSCTFCFNFWAKRVRKRSPESIVTEMRLLEQQFGVEEVFFIDFTFTWDRAWVMEICELMQRENLRIGWTVQTRCDLVDEDLVGAMAAANCGRIWLGIESFDTDVLRRTTKYETADVIAFAVHVVKRAGIEPSAFIMLGLPGETIETLNRTIRGIYDFKLPYTKSIIIGTPRFGTTYYELARRQHPYLGKCWQDLNAIKGLVANAMKPHLIQRTINLLKDRDFACRPKCPQIEF